MPGTVPGSPDPDTSSEEIIKTHTLPSAKFFDSCLLITPHHIPSTMAPPSSLAVATSSVQRLVKEETYYHKELASQQTRVEKLEKEIKDGSKDLDENAEYILRQEVRYHFLTRPLFISHPNRYTDHFLSETSHGGNQECLRSPP